MFKLGTLNRKEEVIKINWRDFLKLFNSNLPSGRFPIKFIFLPGKYDGGIVFQVKTDKIYNVKKTIKREELRELLNFIGLNKKMNYNLNRAVFVIDNDSFGIDIDHENNVFYEYKDWGWAVREYKEVVSNFEDDVIEF